MNRIPFSVYDFFGSLASGFLVLATIDYGFKAGWLFGPPLPIPQAIFWTLAAYIAGHIIANLSGHLIEKMFVRGRLRSPEEVLFLGSTSRWSKVFPGYFEALPERTQKRILAKAECLAGSAEPGRALFYHCHPRVKREQVTLERLNSFLNLYGFARNITMASAMSLMIIVVAIIQEWRSGCVVRPQLFLCLVGLVISGVGMMYRYLKFFRHYTVEVFITYAEQD